MAKHNSLNELFTATANAIRSKTGSTDPIVADDFPSAIENIEAGGGGVVNICESTNPTKDIVSGFSQVGAIIFPNAESIGNSAFYDCDALTSIDLPAATSIGYGAFYDCSSLTSIDLPAATSIGYGAFDNCDALTSIDLPVATSIETEAFGNCDALTSIDLPAATSIGDYAFDNCDALTSIDLPVATSIGDGAFYNCDALAAVILRNTETVCQLIVTAVIGTKIATADGAPTGEGFIYVPTALYEGYVELIAYQAAQLVGDAATAEYIARAVLRKIEDYPEICGTT